MKLFGGLIVVALAGAILISEGHERYKEWSLHHNRPFEPPPPRNYDRPFGRAAILKELLDMRDGETSHVHTRDVTRRGATWTTDGLTFDRVGAAVQYL